MKTAASNALAALASQPLPADVCMLCLERPEFGRDYIAETSRPSVCRLNPRVRGLHESDAARLRINRDHMVTSGLLIRE
jgi:hypothetical protein